MSVRLITDPKLARNPIAKAVARAQLRNRILLERVRLYQLEAGHRLDDGIDQLVHTVAVVHRAMYFSGRSEEYSWKVMEQALDACLRMVAVFGCWHPVYAPILELGLRHAMLAYDSLAFPMLAKAYQDCDIDRKRRS